MTDLQQDILDELYFVTSFDALQTALHLPAETLVTGLQSLLEMQYVKSFYPDPETEITYQPELFLNQYRHYLFLATKAGLLAHNSR